MGVQLDGTSSAPQPKPAEKSASLLSHHRPARLLVSLVVFIFPSSAAAVTAVTGDSDQSALGIAVPVAPKVFLPISALHQFGMPRRTTPVALNAQTSLAKLELLQLRCFELHFFDFWPGIEFLCHGMALMGNRYCHPGAGIKTVACRHRQHQVTSYGLTKPDLAVVALKI